ncbi:MAG TPA: NAD(+) diphosphatase [Kofleriaceae bacterium]|nr:NAD(+) diphosphatase [Kofleriaceae bacterium]
MPPAPDQALCFAFRGRDLLISHGDGRARVLDAAAWRELGIAAVRENDLGGAAAAIAVELPDDAEPPDGMAFENLRRLHGRVDDEVLGLALRAVQIVEWDRGNQFCPRCAGPVDRVPGEFAKRCPRCQTSTYPRLCPAVIVLVERGDAVLLGRNARFPLPMYSTLAGFVEPGETLEQTVHREIREEAGIEVTDLRYFGSQPWPFPDSLMIAFTAVHAGGELRLDPTELSDAAWFELDDLPMVPPRISIARQLIDAWVRRRGGDPDRLRSPG